MVFFTRKILSKALLSLFLISLAAVYSLNISISVSGESMLPTLHDGERGFSERQWSFLAQKEYERFDLIVFEQDGFYIIKRIIGLPNETIKYTEEGLLVDGVPIVDPYDFDQKTYRPNAQISEEGYTMGDDEYFLLGDNRTNSRDSRDMGGVSENDIVAYNFEKLEDKFILIRPLFWLIGGGFFER